MSKNVVHSKFYFAAEGGKRLFTQPLLKILFSGLRRQILF